MFQIVLTKRIGGGVSAVPWGKADEGHMTSANRFAKKFGWMVHILTTNERGEIIRPAIAQHVFTEVGLMQGKYKEFLASQSLCAILEV